MVDALPFFVRAFRSPVDPDRLRLVRENIVAHALEKGLPQTQAWDLASAADELLCNIDEHSGAAWMEVAVELGEDGPRLRISDDGRPFNVQAATLAAADSLPRGGRDRGLGLVVVARMARSVEHRRLDDGANETVLSF
jgi:anti-sigma regulatory factor (Ser/Thr protein kinase)